MKNKLVSVRYLFYQPIDAKIKIWPLCFPAKKNPLIWRRHCLIGQSCSSMISKRSIGWFVERFRACSFFTRRFALPTDLPYPFDKPIKSLYFRSFVVSVMFARFHFKVIRIKIALTRHACADVLLSFCFTGWNWLVGIRLQRRMYFFFILTFSWWLSCTLLFSFVDQARIPNNFWLFGSIFI